MTLHKIIVRKTFFDTVLTNPAVDTTLANPAEALGESEGRLNQYRTSSHFFINSLILKISVALVSFKSGSNQFGLTFTTQQN